MIPEQQLEDFRRRGIRLWRDGEDLAYDGAGKLTDKDREVLRRHKPRFLELLTPAPAGRAPAQPKRVARASRPPQPPAPARRTAQVGNPDLHDVDDEDPDDQVPDGQVPDDTWPAPAVSGTTSPAAPVQRAAPNGTPSRKRGTTTSPKRWSNKAPAPGATSPSEDGLLALALKVWHGLDDEDRDDQIPARTSVEPDHPHRQTAAKSAPRDSTGRFLPRRQQPPAGGLAAIISKAWHGA